MAGSSDFLDASKYAVVSKASPTSPLTQAQIDALASFVQAQGDLNSVSPAVRSTLAGMQAKYASDPNIAGSAAVADFSLRVVSIHKTWGFFKNMKTSASFDPMTLPRIDLNLSHILKTK
jgi:hypothetical protein